MRKIGNIVISSTNNKLEVNDRFNITTQLDKAVSDLPTLIIGWNLIQTIKPKSELNVLKRQLDNNIFWTFTNTERRREFEQDLAKFISHCYNTLIEDIDYVFIDFLQRPDSELDKIRNKISSSKDIVSYIDKDRMMYLYSSNIIFGLDFELCEFTNINVENIKTHFANKSTVVLESPGLENYNEDIKHLNDNVKYLPFLYSIDNN